MTMEGRDFSAELFDFNIPDYNNYGPSVNFGTTDRLGRVKVEEAEDNPKPSDEITTADRAVEHSMDSPGDGSSVDECGEECVCSDEEYEFQEMKSSIVFTQTVSHKESAGFSIRSSRNGHQIEDVDDENDHVRNMNLKSGDKIVAIKDVDVRHFEHIFLVEILQHLYGENSGVFTMVIERQCETGYKYIKIEVKFEFPTRGDSVVSMTVRTTECTSTTFTRIRCVRYNDSSVCWIKSDDMYLSVAKDAATPKLTFHKALSGIDDKPFQFRWFQYNGLEERISGNTLMPSVFFGAFQSELDQTYMVVQSKDRVGLVETGNNIPRNISAVKKPDCRFFKFRLSPGHPGHNKYILESLVFDDVYLSRKGQELRMKKTQFILAPPELLFEIITRDPAS